MSTDIVVAAKVQNVEFVRLFGEQFAQLRKLLNVVQPAKLAAGQSLTVYGSAGTLETTQVNPCAEITVSDYGTTGTPVVLGISKFRKQTSLEDIMTMGYEISAGNTDRSLISDIEKEIRFAMIDALADGTGTATGKNFQEACANAWGELNMAVDGEGATPVFFASPLDAAVYLGSASITMQTAFGLSYIENFLGLGTLIVDANVEPGKIYATSQENLLFAYADASTADGFDFYTDAEGIIGVSHDANITHAAVETVAVFGCLLVPAVLDRVIIATCGSGSSSGGK